MGFPIVHFCVYLTKVIPEKCGAHYNFDIYIFVLLAKNNSNYPCEDVHRAESFDQYYDCACIPEFTGLHCEEDVDECAQSPSPCPDSYTCINKMNGFTCTCPDCGLQPWMIGLIVLAAILAVACIVVVFCVLRTKTKYVYANLLTYFQYVQ